MRERLDCAVLLTRCTQEWVEPILGRHAGGRLHLHGFETLIDTTAAGAHTALTAASMGLRRYDVCLLPVRPSTVSWARTALSHAMPGLQTPVMGLVRDLTATGLHDLYELGVADFLRDPFCSHEARIRIERLLDGYRIAPTDAPVRHLADSAAESTSYEADVDLAEVCRNILNHDGRELEAYAAAAASRCATAHDSFRDAKSKVVERFERAYITAALGRHGGNIAMAARSAQKHRRAFWALMRKHKIDAEPFRAQLAAEGRTVVGACPEPASKPRGPQPSVLRGGYSLSLRRRPGHLPRTGG